MRSSAMAIAYRRLHRRVARRFYRHQMMPKAHHRLVIWRRAMNNALAKVASRVISVVATPVMPLFHITSAMAISYEFDKA